MISLRVLRLIGKRRIIIIIIIVFEEKYQISQRRVRVDINFSTSVATLELLCFSLIAFAISSVVMASLSFTFSNSFLVNDLPYFFLFHFFLLLTLGLFVACSSILCVSTLGIVCTLNGSCCFITLKKIPGFSAHWV